MIGNFIKGTDQTGKPCQGMVMDKVRVLQAVEMKGGGIGQYQQIPFALDAYLVINEDAGSIHLVQPVTINSIGYPDEQDTNSGTHFTNSFLQAP